MGEMRSVSCHNAVQMSEEPPGKRTRGNNSKQVEFKVTHVGSSGLVHADIKIARKSRSPIVKAQSGQSIWDSFEEHALIHGRADCEFSYAGPTVASMNSFRALFCRPSSPLWTSTRFSLESPSTSLKSRRTNLNPGN